MKAAQSDNSDVISVTPFGIVIGWLKEEQPVIKDSSVVTVLGIVIGWLYAEQAFMKLLKERT